MPLTRTRTSLDYEDYGAFNSSLWCGNAVPPSLRDLNRSVIYMPSGGGCAMSYRLNQTIDVPDRSLESRPSHKGSRLSRALKELLGSSRTKKVSTSMDYCNYVPDYEKEDDDWCVESPRKRRGVSVNPTTSHSFHHHQRERHAPPYATPTRNAPARAVRTYSRTPSADAAGDWSAAPAAASRQARAPVRVHSFAVPQPRTVQFRAPQQKKKKALRRDVYYGTDSFVNSHEWTLSRGICELRLGVVGITRSGKTSLIHRYLTGTFTAEDSPEGGRFKKEVVIDGQSNLLLIRDEGNSLPDAQFTHWADAVIFVFSVDNQDSFDRLPHIYNHMNKYRNVADIPLMLVGTKDTVSDKNPRVISEEDGKQMAFHLKKCAYYETSATYGLNVERVFKDVCTRILHRHRSSLSGPISTARTPTPTTPARDDKRDYQDSRYMAQALYGSAPKNVYQQRANSAHLGRAPGGAMDPASSQDYAQQDMMSSHHGYGNGSAVRRPHVTHRESANVVSMHRGSDHRALSTSTMAAAPAHSSTSSSSSQFISRGGNMPFDYRALSPSSSQKSIGSMVNGLHTRSSAALLDITPCDQSFTGDSAGVSGGGLSAAGVSSTHLATPGSTPTTQRKNRRISNIFQRPKEHHHNADDKSRQIEALNLGVGRAIPIKQGHLYKKSTKTALNREWKKKYVCLYSDGRLTYHQNLKDYMDKSTQGKEVFLGLATVKVGGRQRPRNTQRMATSQTERVDENGEKTSERREHVSGEGTSGGASDDQKDPLSALPTPSYSTSMTPQTVAGGQKKRRGAHRRLGSSGKHADEDDECFEIVSCDQKRWELCACSAEERDEWVAAIEEQIEKALQGQMSQPSNRATGNKHEVQALRLLPGNSICADCSAPHPDWASLNLGTLICIECSGVHRQLGSHVSRVRSLELDDWPLDCLAVMQAIGNSAAARLWEFNAPADKKPQPESSREAKDSWIRAKYEQKRYLPPLRVDETVSSQLVAAVLQRDVATATRLLARASPEDVNSPVSSKDRRTPLHLACSIGSLEMVQLLLWNNADMFALDEQGRSGLWHAEHQGFRECAQVLLNAGLPSDHGMPEQPAVPHSIPEGAIMGSLSNRDYSCFGDDHNDVIGRRQSSLIGGSLIVGGPPAPKQRNPSFDMLPASII